MLLTHAFSNSSNTVVVYKLKSVEVLDSKSMILSKIVSFFVIIGNINFFPICAEEWFSVPSDLNVVE